MRFFMEIKPLTVLLVEQALQRRMAQWYAKGKLKKGDEFIHESIIGSKFIGRIEEETTIMVNQPFVPAIEGWARIYGYNTITIDPDDDPYAFGFQVV